MFKNNIIDFAKDLLIYLALKLPIKDVLSLCSASKHMYEKIYSNDNFWRIN